MRCNVEFSAPSVKRDGALTTGAIYIIPHDATVTLTPEEALELGKKLTDLAHKLIVVKAQMEETLR